MDYQLGATCVLFFVCAFIRRRRELSTIKDVPGPVNPSWIFGMSQRVDLKTFTSSQSCTALNTKTFKDTSGISRPEKLEQKIRGFSKILGTSSVGTVHLGYDPPFIKHASMSCTQELLTEMTGTYTQEDHLWIADPKAINHILQKSGYFYAKPSNNREQVALLADRDGIASAEGGLSITIRRFSNLVRSTIPKVMRTSVTGG